MKDHPSEDHDLVAWARLRVANREWTINAERLNAFADEIERLRDALRMIAEESLCPDLWRPEVRKDWSEGELAHRTALVIANAALEPATERKPT